MKVLLAALLVLGLAAPSDATTLYHATGTPKKNVGQTCVKPKGAIWVAVNNVPCGATIFLSVAHDPNHTAAIEGVQVVSNRTKGLVVSQGLWNLLDLQGFKSHEFHYYR